MKVLHLSVADGGGGAARAAYRIHDSVRRAGIDSTMLVRDKTTGDPSVREWESTGSFAPRMWRRLAAERIKAGLKGYRESRPRGLELFTDSRAGSGKSLVPEMAGFDVLHLHWAAGFVDWSIFGVEGAKDTPLVITLHDMNNFTGGCHYTSGCSRFTGRCGCCPQLGSSGENDLSRRNWQHKHRVLANRAAPTHVAGNSEWVAGEAKRSSLLGNFPIQAIHYGIDLETFRPRDKESARRVLGIPAEAALVMFVADGVSNPRKGFAYLVEALKQLRASRPTVLLSVGRGNQRVEGPFEHLHLGSVNNDFFLSIAYSAADVFVIPSLEESFGLTLIEAAACGVAGVGFQAGGIPELIEPGGTGFVVPLKDSAALAGRISEIISDPARCREMGVRSRKRAECLFSLEVQGRKYRDLYAEACGKK